MLDAEVVAVLERHRHLPDDGDDLLDLDRLALALLVDIGERAAVNPLADDDEVRRAALIAGDRLGGEDVEDGDEPAIVDESGTARSALSGTRARIGRGNEAQRHGPLEHRIEALPQLDDSGLGDQDVQDVAADLARAHPSRVRASAASLPDERRSNLRRTRLTTSLTSVMRMAHAAAR